MLDAGWEAIGVARVACISNTLSRIPQFRQRLIIVALRNGHVFEWPAVAEQPVSVWNAIGDMPDVDGSLTYRLPVVLYPPARGRG